MPVKGEPLGVVSNWPPALQAALARWGATQGKSPALTALDITGRPLYTLTYGETTDYYFICRSHGKMFTVSNQSQVNCIKMIGVIHSVLKTNIAVLQDISLNLSIMELYIFCAMRFLFCLDYTSPVHLLSVREAVEPQCEVGVHPPEQAGHQERANPQTWRQGETAHTRA